MSHSFFSSLNRSLFCLRRLSHSLSSSSTTAANSRRLNFLQQEVQDLEPLKRVAAPSTERTRIPEGEEEKARSVEISHPWPEWLELMDHLLKRGYLDRETLHSSFSHCCSSKYSNLVRTAYLNFARENAELIRWAVMRLLENGRQTVCWYAWDKLFGDFPCWFCCSYTMEDLPSTAISFYLIWFYLFQISFQERH